MVIYHDKTVKVASKNCDNLSRAAGSLLPQLTVLAAVIIYQDGRGF